MYLRTFRYLQYLVKDLCHQNVGSSRACLWLVQIWVLYVTYQKNCYIHPELPIHKNSCVNSTCVQEKVITRKVPDVPDNPMFFIFCSRTQQLVSSCSARATPWASSTDSSDDSSILQIRAITRNEEQHELLLFPKKGSVSYK